MARVMLISSIVRAVDSRLRGNDGIDGFLRAAHSDGNVMDRAVGPSTSLGVLPPAVPWTNGFCVFGDDIYVLGDAYGL